MQAPSLFAKLLFKAAPSNVEIIDLLSPNIAPPFIP